MLTRTTLWMLLLLLVLLSYQLMMCQLAVNGYQAGFARRCCWPVQDSQLRLRVPPERVWAGIHISIARPRPTRPGAER